MGSHLRAQAGLKLKQPSSLNLQWAGTVGMPHHAWLFSNFLINVLRNGFQKPATRQRYVMDRHISALWGWGRRGDEVAKLQCVSFQCWWEPDAGGLLTVLFIKKCYLSPLSVSWRHEWLRNKLIDTIFISSQLSLCFWKLHSYFHCAPQQDRELEVLCLWKPDARCSFSLSHAGYPARGGDPCLGWALTWTDSPCLPGR